MKPKSVTVHENLIKSIIIFSFHFLLHPIPMKITTNTEISLLDSPQALIRYYGYLLIFYLFSTQHLSYDLRGGYLMLRLNLYRDKNHNWDIANDGLSTLSPYGYNHIVNKFLMRDNTFQLRLLFYRFARPCFVTLS